LKDNHEKLRKRAIASSNVFSAIAVIVALFSALLVSFNAQTDVTTLRNDLKALKDEVKDFKSSVSTLLGQTPSTVEKPTIEFTLQTIFRDGRLAFEGVGGEIAGKVNPSIQVKQNDVVKITIVNGDGIEHDFVIEGLGVMSEHVNTKGEKTSVTFKAERIGEFFYFCDIPGHRQAGMEGKVIVGLGQGQPIGSTAPPLDVKHIAKNPTDIPPSIKRTEPTTVKVALVFRELTSEIADGTSFTFWTFNGTVPGPLIRVMEGDTVVLTVINPKESKQGHNIDLHAVNGPGGGAAVTNVAPGESKTFRFKALNTGAYIYHCAFSPPYLHISHGMYGIVMVEPRGGLPAVDREFYVVQGEWYTSGKFGEKGHQDLDQEKASAEHPEYFTFNGHIAALTRIFNMTANVGEKVRIIFGVGGPNVGSNFHVIGEIFDKVYTGSPDTYVANEETWYVPPGSAAVFEFKLDAPGRYILVDHALWRLAKGLVGFLYGIGEKNSEIYQ
jgi:nitrite reductase (NO-forming)